MLKPEKITGIILAGGKSLRMQEDKALMQFNGKMFTAHIADALKPLVSEILLVSSNPAHQILGLTQIPDKFENAGPLAGIYSGLRQSKTDLNLILSCDVPLIKTSILQLLLQHADKFDVVQLSGENRAVPLIAMYNKSCLPHFEKCLQKSEYKLQLALADLNVKTISLPPEDAIFVTNVNTPADFERIQG
ncbi:MAG: molybdenum cofactor guanylyltransferase [Cytophagaceae bacterium]|nr:molybdenum cofactor guanylyltransferase [Cytophagaceae bacterium]